MNKKINNQKTKSKKILIILLCFIMAFSGCSANPSKEEPSDSPIIGSENPSADSEDEQPLRGGSVTETTFPYVNEVVKLYEETVLSKLPRYIDATISGDGKTVFDLEYGYKIRDYDGSDFFYEHTPYDDYDFTACFRNTGETDKISFYVPPVFGGTAKNTIKYSVESHVYVNEYISDDGTKISTVFDFITEITVFADAMYDAGHSEGNVYCHTLKHYFTIDGTEESGYTVQVGTENIDNGKTFDVSGWSTFTTWGAIDNLTDVYDSLEYEIGKIVENAAAINESDFEALINQ